MHGLAAVTNLSRMITDKDRFNYIIDVYLWSAASALSATTVCRSAFGAGFPYVLIISSKFSRPVRVQS